VQSREVRAHLDPQLGVEVGQRLVHQERRRLAHDRAAQRHALALATAQRARAPREQVLDPEPPGDRADAVAARGNPLHLQREPHVVLDAHVRIERVGLEDHRDVAVLRRDVVDDAVGDPDLPGRRLFQPRDHPQRRRLAGAGRADQDGELTV
jgi:autonomous glycyl radical cofactor GrcA